MFLILDFKNAVTLKTRLGVPQGHWKCHHSMERCDFLLTFYSNYNMALSCIVSEIFNVEKCRNLEIRVRCPSRLLKVVLFDAYGFLLVFYSNFVRVFKIFDL